MNSRFILGLLVSLLFCTPARAQSLIYALSYSDTRAGFQARFPNGALGASNSDKLAMLRAVRKSEIFSLNLSDGKRTLLFSDEGMNLEIKPTGPVLPGSKACVVGIEREWRTTPYPGVWEGPRSLYEISLDGSRRFRRLFDVQPNQSDLFLNPQGTLAVFRSTARKAIVSVYELPSWKPLHTWDEEKIIRAYCSACSVMSFGWLADGARLFFTLDVVGDDDDLPSNLSYAPGAYLASEEGAGLGLLSPQMIWLPPVPKTPPDLITRRFLTQLPDGRYLFQDDAPKAGGRPGTRELSLVIFTPDLKLQKQFPVTIPHNAFYLSPSGKYLAYLESRTTADYRSEKHLWVLDLQTGEAKDLFTLPAQNIPVAPTLEPILSLSVLGWARDN